MPFKAAGWSLLTLAGLLLLGACATQGAVTPPSAPGFWMGLVHGAIAPFALIGHIFNHDVRIYAVPNTGGWYDFGFLLGLSIVWGGGGAGAASTRRR